MPLRRPSLPGFARLGLEQLERRELMAVGAVGFELTREAGGICGPLPLSEIVAPTDNHSPAPLRAAEYVEPSQGNITAEVVNGVLIIRGDEFGNRFSIYGYGGRDRYEDGSYWIGDAEQEEQKFYLVPGKTLVNGQRLTGGQIQSIAFSGVTAIDIDLGNGNNWLEIHSIEAPQLTIRTGNGQDEVILKGLKPLRMAYTDVWLEYPPIEGPMGGMYAAPQPLHFDGDLFIDTGAGDDQLSPFAAVAGDATVQMGSGDDSYIEVPYELNQIFIQKDPVTGYYPPPERVLGKLTATGALSIDLGAGQDVENIPADWRDDPYLVSHVQNVPRVLDYYQGLVEQGGATPGTAQIITPPYPDVSAAIDAEGRLEIEFGFTRGLGRVIERLQARGVTLDAYSIVRGAARAVIREEDLKLFANLPGIGYFLTRSYLHPELRYSTDPEWDYVRPGSSTAAESPELVTPPETVDSPTTSPTTTTPKPIAGPPRLEEVPVRTAGDFGSLLESFYGERLMGPQPLQ